MNKVKPTADDERYLSNRNDPLIKTMHQTMDYERKITEESRPSKDSTSSSKRNSQSSSTVRLDAVVFVIVLAQLVGYVAIGLAIHAYSLDQKWNKVLHGINELEEVNGHNVFQGKTYKLDGHDYLLKAREYANRREPLEMIFIIVLIIICAVSIGHLLLYYVFTENVEEYSSLHIGVNAVVGALAIFVSAFLVTSATNIENRYSYAADMLHNFRHAYDSHAPISDPTQCKVDTYTPGCPTYEYAKSQAKDLESIFRLCADGSRFTRYYRSHKQNMLEVSIQGEIYTRSELKVLGFCSRDGFKITASVFAVAMGILFSAAPIVYCCEASSDNFEEEPIMDEAGNKLKPNQTVTERNQRGSKGWKNQRQRSSSSKKKGSSEAAPAPLGQARNAPAPLGRARKISDPATKAHLDKFAAFIEKQSE